MLVHFKKRLLRKYITFLPSVFPLESSLIQKQTTFDVHQWGFFQIIFSISYRFSLHLFRTPKLTTIKMSACKFSSESCAQLQTGFKSLKHLDNMEVTEPQTGFKIPTPAGIKRLAVNNIPQDYNDWKWLDTLQDLEDIDVSVGDIGKETGRLYVHDCKAEWIKITDDNAVPILVNVLSNLPTNFQLKVFTN